MKRFVCTVLSLALLSPIVGCGSSNSSENNAGATSNKSASNGGGSQTAKSDGPESALQIFLEAVRTGNDEISLSMLTSVAREKLAANAKSVTPTASDTAKFSIGKVNYIDQAGAQVCTTWTDINEKGDTQSDMLVWVMRREAEGWRVAGMAAEFIPGESPVVLNFEDPEDMKAQIKWVEEESVRRAAVQSNTTNEQQPETANSDNALRR